MKHNRASYVTGKCRCEVCTAANRVYREQQRRRNGQPPRRAPQHGERSMYGKGCRCDACRAANTAHSRAVYARARADTTGRTVVP